MLIKTTASSRFFGKFCPNCHKVIQFSAFQIKALLSDISEMHFAALNIILLELMHFSNNTRINVGADLMNSKQKFIAS